VLIAITDDGRGINRERVRAKAESQGLIQPGALLGDAELFQMIFHPGFSTAAAITNLSGRGVGMDVVKRSIESLRGTIDISSQDGRGTTMTLHLPLTLAIIECMLVRVGEGRYAIPLSVVEECIELPASEVTSTAKRNFLDVRGELVPYVRLRDSFGTDYPADLFQKVVIVGQGAAASVWSSIRSSATPRPSSNRSRAFMRGKAVFGRHHPWRWQRGADP
jgi:two-component system chemotaxis sensor kinase CheA